MLKVKGRYQICAYHPKLAKPYRHKLLAMGMLPGSEFTVIRYAPLGETIKIKINDFLLSLRTQELELLELKEITA